METVRPVKKPTKRKRPPVEMPADDSRTLSLAGFVGAVAFAIGSLLFIQLWAWLMAGWFA